MSNNLPTLGRLGAQLYVRVLSGLYSTGYRKVDPNATFVAGTVAKITSVNGASVVTPVTAVTDTPVGIFWSDKVSTFYRTVFSETVTVGTAGVAVNLAHANIQVSSLRITLADGVTPSVVTTDYSIVNTGGIIVNGQITPISGHNLDGVATCLASYWYQDPIATGIDQTFGANAVAVLEGYGELATSIYDTSVSYTLGNAIYFSATGILSSASGGSAVKIGTITKVPTSDDIELYVKVTL